MTSWCTNQGELLPEVLSDDKLDESYELNITSTSIDISVQSPVGVLRAFSTLGQLIEWNGEAHVISLEKKTSSDGTPGGTSSSSSSCCDPSDPLCLPQQQCNDLSPTTLLHIRDAPRYSWRGLMLDTARHFIPMSALRRYVDGLEELKMNVFHWHIVDAQSFPYVSSTFPKLSELGAYANTPFATYSSKDVHDFIQYCVDRGVRVVPEFDIPGHTASWGKGYPELIIDCPALVKQDDGVKLPMSEHGIDRVALHPLKNSTFIFLEKFLQEIFETFPDPVLHIGGDEVNKNCWSTDRIVQQYAEEHGPTWARQLQALFEQRVVAMLQRGGKTAMVWDEVLGADGVSYSLPKETMVQWWRGWRSEVPSKSIRLGHRFVQSAPWYLDHLNDDWLKMYQATVKDEMYGGEACSWSEHSNDANSDHRIFSRLPSIAERLWSNKEFTRDAVSSPDARADTARRLGGMLCRLNKRVGVNVAPAYPDYCGALLSSSAVGKRIDGGGDGGDGGGGGGGGGSNNISLVQYKSAMKSMREWQFVAFTLGALVLFGCVALIALCVARKCGGGGGSGRRGRQQKRKRRRKKNKRGNRAETFQDNAGDVDDQEDGNNSDQDDVEMVGLL